MKELIGKFCEATDDDRNLLLIDMPTGTGKTHKVLDYIAEYVRRGGEKKIFFITTLKKNLPSMENLKNRFEESDAKLFYQSVMRVDPLSDAVKNKFKDLTQEERNF